MPHPALRARRAVRPADAAGELATLFCAARALYAALYIRASTNDVGGMCRSIAFMVGQFCIFRLFYLASERLA